MARYALNLPTELKLQAERLAEEQGISLNQFILWAVAEKVGELRSGLDDPHFARVTYQRGATGQPIPVLRGAGIPVQTLVLEKRQGYNLEHIAGEYGLSPRQVSEALSFYDAHRTEIDAKIEGEQHGNREKE